MDKVPYICGPLTDLWFWQKNAVKSFYADLADVCHKLLGTRAFVPHEHFDPIQHARFTPEEVDYYERRQICEHTSLLIVIAIAPSWGGGIEVEMANHAGIPSILLWHRGKKVSRLLRGNPSIHGSPIVFNNFQGAINLLRIKLLSMNILRDVSVA